MLLDVSYTRDGRRAATTSLRRRHAHSYSIASVVGGVARDGTDLRVALAGVGATAVRCTSVEASQQPGDVLADVEPVDDAVASAAYRRAVLPPLVGKALDQLELA